MHELATWTLQRPTTFTLIRMKFATVTIGIPAYNEERNIHQLLRSIEKQSCEGFSIAEVIISDDSSDRTAYIVEDFRISSPLNIKIIHHDKRRGGAAAWNEIFSTATSDVIVLYDADIILHHNCTRRLLSRIATGAALCASNPQPIPSKEIAGRAAQYFSNWLRAVRKSKLSQYTVMGRALAIDSSLAKTLQIPESIIAIDLYLQCKVLDSGLPVEYDDGAIVYFQPTRSMADTASQVIRSSNGHRQLKEFISNLSIALPLSISIKQIIRLAIADPVGALAALACFSLIPYYKNKLSMTNSSVWSIAQSSKSIDYERLSTFEKAGDDTSC